MKSIKVWDIIVRLTHWSVAALVLANLFATEDGSTLHRYAGYTACALVGIRLLWGLVGSRHARFSDFFPTPARLVRHIRDLLNGCSGHELGHNPIGALMIFALWGCIIGLGISGYLMGTDAYWGEEWLEELHEILANGLMGLVALHIAAAVLMSKLSRSNLVKAMITGKKELPDETEHGA